MINKFDAWEEPWIPIETMDGKKQMAGIFETLRDAHRIRAVRAATPTETFGIQRLLITFLTDIYRPEWPDDLDALYHSGQIEAIKLAEYHKMCMEEGCSFDLFDTKKPFLQYAFPNQDKLEKKPVANLFDHLPTGNNVPHFLHNAEDYYLFSPARCLQALCAIPLYEKHKRGKKVTTGINGAPPIYFLYNGDSLFETLVLSMTAKSQYRENDYGLPIWRDKNLFSEQSIVTPSYLHALFSAPLKLQLISSEKEPIGFVVMEEGVNYKEAIWKDPNVAYTMKQQERIALKAKNGRAIWRDMPLIIEPNALNILYEWDYRDLDKKYTDLIAYVKYCELKGTVFMAVTQFTEELKIPVILLSDNLKRACYAKAVEVSDNISKECGNALKRTQRQLSGNGSKDEVNPFGKVLPQAFSELFLSEVRQIIEDELVTMLANADTDKAEWEKDINDFLYDKFQSAVYRSLKTVLDTVSDENVETLILKNKLRNNAIKKMHYILKRGGYADDSNRDVKKRTR